ncbi:MAG: hypothetical protein A2725_04270 [Candidatus Magasanikbacteria bacterium RIFCSPHIGHO2_01_FULL_33_34]|uniref:GST N-terminal domain-containing protein n=1 Tax=Candidatus Magasanikbacteria bacterium RIFCSPHIGHO2_01_FULL_33_34 TaxID=1798671 RepID=A0A1F6LHY3_9BACT|nr:MAG: hypothetical protein A2725_04270 [Candidatus Magasanikbacteria bacterium RIFCSPHIGHO2_01_FULL_33_34]OGH65181.1 MAG: hypothetical protein A3B83_04030 [Candidatus Magasanikbacteria bacterium RIFCSPHIGHO2_02_FULL_33_17]OGH75274.1 MAG: hypothetical protein A3A89_04135 [Candidatus Magasanikbacteria bacterium RIFCSPLOWO2_01_FULL_33_34]OGH81029.1 MAG: hypothetical protein A3F93_00165 [Candidatus Magasanikbacteria bacterium RIFCSPLOWO2_12_FULL_34_7]
MNIKIYTTPTCPYCERAKELLNSINLEYKEVDVESNPEERVKLIEDYQWMTVPAVFIDDKLVGGYDDLVKIHSEGKLFTK